MLALGVPKHIVNAIWQLKQKGDKILTTQPSDELSVACYFIVWG